MTSDPDRTPAFRELCRLAGQAIARYRMIGEGERILVGLSGGKDSFLLLHVLHALQRRAPIRFEIVAATFDPGFPEFNADAIADYCRERSWEHRVVRLDVAALLEEKQFRKTPCVLCSRLRRGKLYGLAEQEHCGKLALGQHFDDLAVSFLMSLCRGQGLTTMGPNVAAKAREHIRIIRPLALAPESLLLRCREERELPAAGKCRYEEQLAHGDRAYFRQLLDQLAARIPNLRSQMLRSLGHIQTGYLLDPAFLDFGEPGKRPDAGKTPRNRKKEKDFF